MMMYDHKVTPEQIDALIREAHVMRAEAIRSAVHGAGQAISSFFHRLFARQAHG